MPRYSAEQIYGFARRAGFSPDESATMTAIALAESGGNSKAHNPHGEDSRGLWQINGKAHPDFLTKYNLYDPVDNAKAAFEISHKGDDVSPWTTTHGGLSSRYVRYKEDAQSAAVAYGDGPDRGMWSGTRGYGDHKGAASGDDPAGVALHDVAGSPMTLASTTAPTAGADNAALDTFLKVAKAQIGDRYVFGAEVKLSDPNPAVFDCSEFTQWAAFQAGSKIPDGATAQYLHFKEKGMLVPVDQAKDIPGALLFSFDREPRAGDGRTPGAHVAISLGDGKVVEAANPRVGVRESNAGNRFEFAAIIPGISDGTGTPIANPVTDPLSTLMATQTAAPITPEPVALGGADTDRDGLSDLLERRYGLDPLRADTDGDNLTDAQEMVTYHTDGRKADTDGDGLNDAFELAQGLDPRSPDSDADGHMDGALTPLAQADSDSDGLDDSLEKVLGFNTQLSDSDSDGFSDALEYHNGSNPLDAHDNPLLHGQFAQQQDQQLGQLGTNGSTQIPGGQLADVTDLP
ncbi:transglycosylase SLT domain-containing protein [Actinoplanes sp. NPDC026619]|uniref:transglycosylase SLT domain-containing protein n=1 Tax=Actinoplanes sp. NPDC026619 TaxID=3155798 RepID=UPI0033DCA5BE